MRSAYLAILPAALLLLSSASRLRGSEPEDLAEDERVLREAKLPTEGAALLDLYRQRTLSEARTRHIPRLVRQLASDDFEIRRNATEELKAIGPPALPLLRQAGARVTDAEAKNRLRDCIETLEGIPSAEQALATTRLVRARKPAGSVAVLLAYLPFADDESVESEVLLTLAVVGVRREQVEGALVSALTDPEPSRRAAAALVLGRYGTKEQQAKVRSLLTDPEPRIRLRAAQGLLAARERASVPVLLGLLEKAPLATAYEAESLLTRAAGDASPAAVLTEDSKDRQKCVAEWQAWWKTNESKLDLAKADVDITSINADTLARMVCTQFFQAVTDRNLDRILKTIDVPFNLMGMETFQSKEEFTKMIAAGAAPPPNAPKPKLKMLRSMSVEEYTKKAPPVAREFVKQLRKTREKLIYMVIEVDGRLDGAVLLVRVTGGKARVMGLGMVNTEQK